MLPLLLIGVTLLSGEVDISVDRLCRLSPDDVRNGMCAVAPVQRALARPEVRAELWKRVRQGNGGASRGDRDGILHLLCWSGVQESDIDGMLAIAKERRRTVSWALQSECLESAARVILLHAPFALTPIIEAKLLAPLAQGGADSLDGLAPMNVYLLSQRLPAAKIRAALARAWSQRKPVMPASELERRAFVELAVVPPAGIAREDLLCVIFKAPAIIWPDGKARLYDFIGDGGTQREQNSASMPGFYESEPVKVELVAGKSAACSAVFKRKRSVVRGIITPAPKSPLLVLLARDLPQAKPVNPPILEEYNAIVHADGGFACPYTRQGGLRKFLVADMDGTLLHAIECPLPEQGGDVELGTIELPEQAPSMSVPILLTWDRAIPIGQMVRLQLTWIPEDPALPRNTVETSIYSGDGALNAPDVLVGAARNLLPGPYKVLVQFPQMPLQGPVEDISTTYTVKAGAEPLRLKAVGKAGAAPQNPANAEEYLDFKFLSSPALDLGSRPDGTPFAVWRTPQGLLMRTGDDAAPGAITLLCGAAELRDNMCADLRCFVDAEGGLHVFAVGGRRTRGVSLCYRRFTAEGKVASAWIRLPEREGEEGDLNGFGIFPGPKRDSFEILASVLEGPDGRQRGANRAWIAMKLAGDAVTTKNLPVKLPADTAVGDWPLVIGASLERCGVLFDNNAQLTWASVPQFRFSSAGVAANGLFGMCVDVLYSTKGTAYVAYGQPEFEKMKVKGKAAIRPNSNRLRVCVGAVGAKLSSLALSQELVPYGHRGALAEAPDGKVYFFSLPPSQDKDAAATIVCWNLSSAKLRQIDTGLRAKPRTPIRAVFKDAKTAYVAHVEGGKLRVSSFSLEE